jgi:hypothetical protein
MRTNGGSPTRTCLDQSTGAAIGLRRLRSSSGAIAPPDCMSGSGLSARRQNRPGKSGSFIPDSKMVKLATAEMGDKLKARNAAEDHGGLVGIKVA